MGDGSMVEIERKFVVEPDILFAHISSERWENFYPVTVEAGYFNMVAEPDLGQARISLKDDKEFCFNAKGIRTGASRGEYEITKNVVGDELAAIKEFLSKIQRKIKRTRYHVDLEGNDWCIDFMEDVYEGMILAEVEVPDENYHIQIPQWIAKEITDDERLYMKSLALARPYPERVKEIKSLYTSYLSYKDSTDSARKGKLYLDALYTKRMIALRNEN